MIAGRSARDWLFPFASGNRIWLVVVARAYFFCMFLNVALGLIFYAAEGMEDRFFGGTGKPLEHVGRGESTLDEALWFVYCTFHGTSFGDVYPRTTAGRLVAMLVALLGYFFFALKMCVILLSQLAGEPPPTTFSVPKRMVRAAAPSFVLLVLPTPQPTPFGRY